MVFWNGKNHKYIAANATVDLANCSLYDLVFSLINQNSKSQGRMKTIAKKDLKIICDKLKSVDRYLTRVFNKQNLGRCKKYP